MSESSSESVGPRESKSKSRGTTCSNCRAELQKGDKFCPECGTRV